MRWSSEFAAQEATRNVAAFSEDLIDILEKRLARVHILADEGRHHRRLNLKKKTGQFSMPLLPENCTHLLAGDARHFGMWLGKSVSGIKIMNQFMMTEELRFWNIVD